MIGSSLVYSFCFKRVLLNLVAVNNLEFYVLLEQIYISIVPDKHFQIAGTCNSLAEYSFYGCVTLKLLLDFGSSQL